MRVRRSGSVSRSPSAAASGPASSHGTTTPVSPGRIVSAVVRAVETVDNLTLESDAAPPACKKFVDTFPPAAPKGLTAVPTEGAVNLIWQPNGEKDLNGYLVLRAVGPGENLGPVTSSPIREVTFKDAVQPGVRYVYAVVAVDKAGNTSAPSNAVEETAR